MKKGIESPGLLSKIHRTTTGFFGKAGRVKDVLGLAIGLGGQPMTQLPDMQARPPIISKKETRRGEGGKDGTEGVSDKPTHV